MAYKDYSYLADTLNQKKKAAAGSSKKPEKKAGNLFLFYILPFIIINMVIFFLITAQPDYQLTTSDSTDFRTVNISLTLKGLIPATNVSVLLENTPVELTDVGDHTYTAILTGNGLLEIHATNFNGMTKTQYEHISSIDDLPPVITAENSGVGDLSVLLEDTQSGTNFASIYALDDNEERVEPESIDETNSLVTFKTTSQTLEVHASDVVGNESVLNCDGLQQYVNNGKNSSDEENETSSEKKSADNESEASSKTEKETSAASKKETSSAKASSSASKESSAAAKSSTAAKSTSAASKESSSASKTTAGASKESTAASKASTEASKESSATVKSSDSSQNSQATNSTTEASQENTSTSKTAASLEKTETDSLNNQSGSSTAAVKPE